VLDADEQLQHALELAYRYLDRRDRTVNEMGRHLERRSIEAALVAEVIATLIHQRFLDDARFARLFVQDKREFEQWGSERIRHALLDRGVEPELVEAALGDAAAGGGEMANGAGEGLAAPDAPEGDLDRAVVLLRRRFPSPPRDRRERDRALGVLLRKGYDSEVALDALRQYAREAEHPGVR
jgi:regulatory protein